MFTPEDDSNEATATAQQLADHLTRLGAALDHGRSVADAYFDTVPHDPHLWAHLVRFHAVHHLEQRGAMNDGFRKLSHSGLEIHYAGHRVRICKAIADGPQSPGRSKARREFFQQMTLNVGALQRLNLLLYWLVNSDGQLQMVLCKPKGLWRFLGTPKVEWRQPITYTASSITFTPADDDDLNITYRVDPTEPGQADAS